MIALDNFNNILLIVLTLVTSSYIAKKREGNVKTGNAPRALGFTCMSPRCADANGVQ